MCVHQKANTSFLSTQFAFFPRLFCHNYFHLALFSRLFAIKLFLLPNTQPHFVHFYFVKIVVFISFCLNISWKMTRDLIFRSGCKMHIQKHLIGHVSSSSCLALSTGSFFFQLLTFSYSFRWRAILRFAKQWMPSKNWNFMNSKNSHCLLFLFFIQQHYSTQIYKNVWFASKMNTSRWIIDIDEFIRIPIHFFSLSLFISNVNVCNQTACHGLFSVHSNLSITTHTQIYYGIKKSGGKEVEKGPKSIRCGIVCRTRWTRWST